MRAPDDRQRLWRAIVRRDFESVGDRLAEWERGMKEHVGLGKVDSLALKAAGGSCLSWCGGQTPEAGNFPDDCDQL